MAVDLLASCCDKLKAFDRERRRHRCRPPPRGNDNPGASSNSSISPVRWIRLSASRIARCRRQKRSSTSGHWHCYPKRETRTRSRAGCAWPNTGCVNAARVKLALWDAFNNTAQPLPSGVHGVSTSGSTLYGNTSRTFVDLRRAGEVDYAEPWPVTRTTRTRRSSRSRSRRRTTTSSSTSRTVSRRAHRVPPLPPDRRV